MIKKNVLDQEQVTEIEGQFDRVLNEVNAKWPDAIGSCSAEVKQIFAYRLWRGTRKIAVKQEKPGEICAPASTEKKTEPNVSPPSNDQTRTSKLGVLARMRLKHSVPAPTTNQNENAEGN